MIPRDLVKGLLLLVTLVAVGYAAAHGRWDIPYLGQWLDREVVDQGLRGQLLFAVLGGIATGLGLPRQILAFLAGQAFGVAWGTLLSTLATVLGCVLGFYYARWIGRDFVQRRYAERISDLDRFLQGHVFAMALVIRLLPVGHNAATNFLAGVSGVRAWPFFAGSAVGFLPQNLVFALAGAGLDVSPDMHLLLAALLFLLSGGLGIWLYRRHRRAISGAGFEDSRDSG